jgi:hypothetical protein
VAVFRDDAPVAVGVRERGVVPGSVSGSADTVAVHLERAALFDDCRC